MTVASYQQFCPVAMAAEILCTRWTIVLLREMVAGSTRFNELRRGVPRMSPALLSRRLKELEQAGIVAHAASESEPGVFEYHLTEAGRELQPLVEAFGIWGQRRIEAELSLKHLDVDLLMWDMRRSLNTTPMPARRSVIQFLYPGLPAAQRRFWLVVDPQSGTVKINRTTTGNLINAPFGGLKRSSTSTFRESGRSGLEFYTQITTVYRGI